MTRASKAAPIDPGLLARFLQAGKAIVWKSGSGSPRGGAGPQVRVAHLYEEEARVESWDTADGAALRADSGPVGALVVILEIARRGVADRLLSQNAGRAAGFSSGALVAVWGSRENPPADSSLALEDLVELARYALR